ncbi:MAG: hypothetical protein C0442_06775 [Chlorobiaceae bacterium]|nr:hypothetical protein [Chlorobiaceae bacterium]
MINLVEIIFQSLEMIPDLCFITKADGEILNLNQIAIEKLNCKKEKVIGKKFSEILAPHSILTFEYEFHESLKIKKNTKLEGRIQTADEKIIALKLILSRLDFSEKEKYILIYGHDITEERQREIDLLRFYYVAENTVNPLQITDLSGKMIFVNPAFVEASGYSKEELIGKSPSIFGSNRHSPKFWDSVWNIISEGKVWSGDLENKKKDGSPFYTNLLISPILNDSKKVVGYFGIHRDLTEKKLLEKQLIHTQKMESIGALAAGVAHEVGNPLASISALVQIVQRQTEDSFTKEKLELVKKQVDRISKIIRDLVDFSRPSNYELKLTDLNENLKEAIEIVRVGKKAKNINFIEKFDSDLPPLPLVSDQMQQVFVNILINAVDAVAERKANSQSNFNGEISISTSWDLENVKIIFADNGIGIKEENFIKVFEPFFTTKKEGKGTGLGLWVSYGIIKSFQGDIKIESNLNRGSKFIVSLPN